MINYRNVVSNEFKEIYRTLNEKSPKRSYQPGKEKIFNCHDGQRKLLYSEIEYYNYLGKIYDLNDILVVYVGSGEGLHMSLIFDMFPQLDFILIDPNKSLCKHAFMKNKEKVIQINEYYTDSFYLKIKTLNKKNKKIAFMSDIREDLDELEIWKNMIQQQLWCIQLDSIAYLLKFRLPYFTEKFDIKDYKYFIPLSDKKSIYEFKDNKNNQFDVVYLKGDIFIQIYAPSKSSETRLMYIRKPNELFTFKNYNIRDYEDQCFYFNTIGRQLNYKYENSELMKYNLLGFDDGYESVSEYLIISQYIDLFYEKYKNTNYLEVEYLKKILENPKISKTAKCIQILYYIDLYYTRITNKNLIECTFRSAIKRKALPEKIKDEKEKERVNEFVEIIKNKYFEVIFSMKTQISFFLKNNINFSMLNEEEYKEQIKYSSEILKGINFYMKDILSRKYLKKDEKYYITLNLIDTKEDIISKYIENNKNKIILSKNELNQMINTSSDEFIKLNKINKDYKDLLNELKGFKKNKKSVNSYFV
jgi:hypothetical protein